MSALRGLIGVMACGLAIIAVACLAAREWWLFELLTHFRIHYLAAALLVIPAALALRLPWIGLLAALSTPHLPVVLGRIAGPTAPSPVEMVVPLRLTTINVNSDNPDHDRLLAHIRATRPDVLVLQETSASWRPALAALAHEFPHGVPPDWPEGNDVILLSRHPIHHHRLIHAAAGPPVFIVAELALPGGRLDVIAVHPPYPMGPRLSAIRNRNLTAIAEAAAVLQGPRVIAGDFNLSPWSPYFTDLLDRAGVGDAAAGPLRWPTFPASLRWFDDPRLAATRLPGWDLGSWVGGWLGIPIDHILIGGDINATSVTRGPAVGSDHFPLTADLLIPIGR